MTLFGGSFIEFNCLFLVSSIFKFFLAFNFVATLNNFSKKVAPYRCAVALTFAQKVAALPPVSFFSKVAPLLEALLKK